MRSPSSLGSLRSLRLCAGFALLAALALPGCAHSKKKPDLNELRPLVDEFMKQTRWGDLRTVGRMCVAEKRLLFLKSVLSEHLDEKLKIYDVELEGVERKGELRAVTLFSVEWHLLPSVVMKREPMTVEWFYDEGAWRIDAIDGGPLPALEVTKKKDARGENGGGAPEPEPAEGEQ